MSMLICSGCEGFVPAKVGNCPHCDSAMPKRSSKLRKVLNVAGGGAIAMTLMACYGGGPAHMREPTPPPQTPTNAATCTDPSKDIDGDNYCESDCDEMNKEVHPGAHDPPNDGIDQNCDGADGVKTDTVAQ